jgi:hypothetical protein
LGYLQIGMEVVVGDASVERDLPWAYLRIGMELVVGDASFLELRSMSIVMWRVQAVVMWGVYVVMWMAREVALWRGYVVRWMAHEVAGGAVRAMKGEVGVIFVDAAPAGSRPSPGD